MKRRFIVAPLALRPYIPGDLSGIYNSLERVVREKIAAEADKLFIAKTGVRRKINEHNPSDRILVRQWLLIRDAVIAIRHYEEVAWQVHRRNLQAEIEVELIRSSLPAQIRAGGLPPEITGSLAGKIVAAAHLTTEAMHVADICEFVWPHFVAVSLEAVGPYAAVAGPVVSMIATLAEIAEAHEVGDQEAERQAFIHGFASYLVFGRVINRLPAGQVLGDKQILGERVAMRFLLGLAPDVRLMFLRRYQGPQRYPGENMSKALNDMGYRIW